MTSTPIVEQYGAIRARMEELRGESKPTVMSIDLVGGWYRLTPDDIKLLEGLTVAPKTEPAPPPPPLYPPAV